LAIFLGFRETTCRLQIKEYALHPELLAPVQLVALGRFDVCLATGAEYASGERASGCPCCCFTDPFGRCLAWKVECVLPSLESAKTPARTSSVESIGNAPDEGLLSGVLTAAAKTQSNSAEETLEGFHRKQFDKSFPSTAFASHSGSPQSSFSDQTQYTNISILPRIKDVLTPEDVQKCLLRYRSISPVYFPFVIVPNDWTLQSMMKHSPTLLLAVLTTMCDSTHLQKTLDAGFREVVSQRVLVRGEKTLDILQGLLVYLAWHPFHLKPLNRQIHQFVQMAATMTMDMKLHVIPESTGRSIEDKRAYLGCYYMSSV
jgi:hypothetical protein